MGVESKVNWYYRYWRRSGEGNGDIRDDISTERRAENGTGGAEDGGQRRGRQDKQGQLRAQRYQG